MIKLASREIVIEFERVKTIRKRCRTKVLFCSQCGSEADFISLAEAAALFEVEAGRLRKFISHHICHVSKAEFDILICVGSFLEGMRAKLSSADPLRRSSGLLVS